MDENKKEPTITSWGDLRLGLSAGLLSSAVFAIIQLFTDKDVGWVASVCSITGVLILLIEIVWYKRYKES